jgi:hypothetical protein
MKMLDVSARIQLKNILFTQLTFLPHQMPACCMPQSSQSAMEQKYTPCTLGRLSLIP